MDFFTHQESARRRSRYLLLLFLVANFLLVLLISLAMLVILPPTRHGHLMLEEQMLLLPVIGFIDVVVLLTVFWAALSQFRALSSSGGAVAERLGGRKVSPETGHPLERRYRNVVEEMALAANCAVPEAYVLANEEAINAFASGSTPENSAVVVTRGALELLTREELQGIVAHEFSHIVHGDVRFNIRLAAYIAGLNYLSAIGTAALNRVLQRMEVRCGGSGKKDKLLGGGTFLVLLIIACSFLIFGMFGRLVSLLLGAAISREREYLADATAVQLTRNTDGIAGALKKIGGLDAGSRIKNPAVKGIAHFCFASAREPSFLNQLFAAHPPIEARVRRIEQHFSGKFPASEAIGLQVGQEEFGLLRLSGSQGDATRNTDANDMNSVVARALPLHAEWAPPIALHGDVVAIGGAEAIVIITLLSLQEEPSSSQRSFARQWAPLHEIDRLQVEVSKLSLNQRVSLVLMAIPSIRAGAISRRKAFLQGVIEIVMEDWRVTMGEFLLAVLVRLATQEIDETFTLRGGSIDSSLKGCARDISRVLSACAQFATDDVARQKVVFQKAAFELNLSGSFVPEANVEVPQFMKSIVVVRSTAPIVRSKLMRACEALIREDGVITENEVAVMRILAILLRTQLPKSVDAST